MYEIKILNNRFYVFYLTGFGSMIDTMRDFNTWDAAREFVSNDTSYQ